MIATTLPEVCYVFLPDTKRVGVIMRGERGYHTTNWPDGYTQEQVDKLNAQMGVSIEQAKAMHAGSMFGWHIPGADPAVYAPDYKSKKGRS